ncbi:MAG: TetR/AcrR family transcriptional regulator [Mycobacterium sp.]|nr:TetR/AcrR family transcriptional regulator [Mycobacterium sp.]
MPLQARAEATRRRILDSAVDLFDELGYGETGLADVLQRAGVSKGAFYYHFDSKEALATAIIDDYRRRNAEAVRDRSDCSATMLEQIITATYVSAALIEEDKTARIGNQLLQALSQISSGASQIYAEWTSNFIAAFVKGLETIGLRDGVDAAEVAEAIWAGILGCHLLSSALGDDPYSRLTRSWRAVLKMTIADDMTDHYLDLLDRNASRHQRVG